jgi:hypothetical protein
LSAAAKIMIHLTDREQIKGYLEEAFDMKIRDRAIRAIKVNPTQQALPPLDVRVGRPCANLEPGAASEEVLAIFDSTVFLVCTPSRGAGRGLPYFFAREDVRNVELME